VEEDELRKDGKKSWKTMENTSINLYCIDFFFIVMKRIVKKWQEFLQFFYYDKKKSIQYKLIDLININICTLKFEALLIHSFCILKSKDRVRHQTLN